MTEAPRCQAGARDFGVTDLAAAAHRSASVLRQHQGAVGVFDMQMKADQRGPSAPALSCEPPNKTQIPTAQAFQKMTKCVRRCDV